MEQEQDVFYSQKCARKLRVFIDGFFLLFIIRHDRFYSVIKMLFVHSGSC